MPPRRERDARRFQPINQTEAYVGIDLGAYNSKASIAFKAAERHGLMTQLHRVPTQLDEGHAHFSRRAHGLFELPAVAAVDEDGTILVGGAAEKKAETFPLKAALMVLAGVTVRDEDETLLLGAETILTALSSGKVTREGLKEAVCDHLRTIRKITLGIAQQSHVKIVKLVLTYPNFLSGRSVSGDIDRYLDYYIARIKEIWPDVSIILTVSEGQAAACYITKPFRDPTFSSVRPGHRRLFAESNVAEGFNILVADGGSSSLNIQVQNIYFDDYDSVTCSQSSVGQDWLEGTRGGSHVSNQEALKIIKEKLKSRIELGLIDDAELAVMLEDFERKKYTLDFDACIQEGRGIMLHGHDEHMAYVDAQGLEQAFGQAFDAGVAALRAQVQALVSLGRDFVVLFVGGSYGNPALRRRAERVLAEELAQAEGLTIRSAFLSDQEKNYLSSAVSAGAALAAVDIPKPAVVMRDSAIALHPRVPMHPQDPDGVWVGEAQADVLFSPGCWTAFVSYYDTKAYEGGHVQFRLVCEPTYKGLEIRRKRRTLLSLRAGRNISYYQPIDIGVPSDVLNGPVSTYDLGWDLEDKALPSGKLVFWMSGSAIKQLARDKTHPEVAGEDAIPLTFTCLGLNEDGRGHRRDPLDKRWSLVLKTDPATGMLIIEEKGQLPVWCASCRQLLEKLVFECQTCGVNRCEACTLVHANDYRNHDTQRSTIDCEL